MNSSASNFITTDPTLCFSIEDSVSNELLNRIKNFDWSKVEWYFTRDSGYIKTSQHNMSDKEQIPFLDDFVCLNNQNLKKIDPDGMVENIVAFNFRLSSNNGKMTRGNFHQDSLNYQNEWTFLYHLLGNSGPTDFYNNGNHKKLIKSYDFKPGRCIIFPSSYFHQGSLPDNEQRLILNMRCKINSKLNKQILSKSPAAIQKILLCNN